MSQRGNLPVTYTVEDVAKILNRSVQTIRKLIKDGVIPAPKIGGRYVIKAETLQKLLDGEIDTGEEE